MSSVNLSHATLAAYVGNKEDIGLRDEVIVMAIPIVRVTAERFVSKKEIWVPSHIDAEELFSEGLSRLIEVVEIFNPPPSHDDLPRAFHMHVRTRMRWRLLDFVRGERSISRTSLDHGIQFKAAYWALVEETGYAPTIGEIAGKLGVALSVAEEWRIAALALETHYDSMDRVVQFQRGGNSARQVSVSDVLTVSKRPTPEEQDAAFEALLPPSLSVFERAIIVSIFRDNKTMLEIASAFGFSESRVSQVFSDLMPRVRAYYFSRLRKDAGECDE